MMHQPEAGFSCVTAPTGRSPPVQGANSDRGGFTLNELTASLTLFGTIFLGLFATLSTGFSKEAEATAVESPSARVEVTRDGRHASDRRVVSSAIHDRTTPLRRSRPATSTTPDRAWTILSSTAAAVLVLLLWQHRQERE